MKKLFCLGAGALMLCACSEMSNPQTSSVEDNKEPHSINVISSAIISDPAQDPYTVENMSKALRKVALFKSVSAQDSADASALTLGANYLYVRFLCEGKEGVRELKKYDPSLVLFKRPMDYKPVDKSIVYKDSALPEGVIPMFASVPVDYNFGPTKYEVIKELFLVEHSDEEDGSHALLKRAKGLAKATASKMEKLDVSLSEVEWASLEMTGNIDETLKSEKSTGKQKMAWSLPSLPGAKKYGGQLSFRDDGIGILPLVGVRVTGGYSYLWREGHTDSQGKFSIPDKWSMPVTFEANFDSGSDFVMEDGESTTHLDLEIQRSGKRDNWVETFSGADAHIALIWTAAYQYWYGNNYGFRRPPKGRDIEIEVFVKKKSLIDDSDECFYRGNVPSDLPDAFPCDGNFEVMGSNDYDKIKLVRGKELSEMSKTYGKVIYALGRIVAEYNSNCSTVRAERAYGKGMEWYFTKTRYGFGSDYYPTYSEKDPGLYQDLFDTDSRMGGADGTSGDLVYGLDIKYIEDAYYKAPREEFCPYLKKNYSSQMYIGASYAHNLENLCEYWGL